MKIKLFGRTVAQLIVLITFAVLAIGSGATTRQVASSVDWRGAAVGGVAGYNGYTPIGNASSESEAKNLAIRKGYENAYLWDSVNGVVYAK